MTSGVNSVLQKKNPQRAWEHPETGAKGAASMDTAPRHDANVGTRDGIWAQRHGAWSQHRGTQEGSGSNAEP